MWELIKEKEKKRNYRSTVTGTELSMSLLLVDGGGEKWWAFDDLMQIPYSRKLASSTLSQLYGSGLSAKDIKTFAAKMKDILKGNSEERYERAYSEVLQLESIAENNLNPLKQELGLCSIYIVGNDERIDVYDSNEAAKKIEQWAQDTEATIFFLEWFTSGISDLNKRYTETSETVLKAKEIIKRMDFLAK